MNKNLISWLRHHLALLVLLSAAFLIYAPSLSGDFVIDDIPFIKDNPYIRDFSHIARFFTKGVWENSALEVNNVSIYRPMNLIPMLLNHAMWGNNPVGYHVFLLLLHLANTCLVYVLIRKLVVGSAMAATIGAALFALHPARVESVAWISGGIDPLVTFFLLGAMLAHLSFVDSSNTKKEWRYLALSLLCFQLALWSKEVAIVFPLIAVAYGLTYRKKIPWPTISLYALLIVVYLVARSLVLGEAGKWGAINLKQFSRAIDFALGYCELLLFPAKIPFYLQPPEHSVSSALGVAGAIIIIMLAVFSWRVFDSGRRKTLIFSAIWIVGFFWPAILLAFYAEGYYAARNLYIPAVGVAIFSAALYEYMNETYPGLKIPVITSCVLIASIYGIVTLKEIPAWRDNETIYGKIAGLAPESDGGFSGLGQFYLLKEDYAAAEKNYLLALQKSRNPQNRVSALVALGTIQGMSNNLTSSERYLSEAVQIDPNNSEAWAGLGNLAWMQGRTYDAISSYEKAVSIHPGNYEAAMNLAMAYEKIGQPERGASVRQQAAIIRR